MLIYRSGHKAEERLEQGDLFEDKTIWGMEDVIPGVPFRSVSARTLRLRCQFTPRKEVRNRGCPKSTGRMGRYNMLSMFMQAPHDHLGLQR